MKSLIIHILTAEEAQYNPINSRLGVVVLQRETLYTIERPWIPNTDAPDGIGGGEPFESAVPGDGAEYELVLHDSPKFGSQWHLVNPALHVYLLKTDCPDYDPDREEPVFSRYGCMLHAANYVHQLLGCVAPGCSLGDINGDGVIDVGSSRAALVKIKGYLEGETRARLVIK